MVGVEVVERRLFAGEIFPIEVRRDLLPFSIVDVRTLVDRGAAAGFGDDFTCSGDGLWDPMGDDGFGFCREVRREDVLAFEEVPIPLLERRL